MDDFLGSEMSVRHLLAGTKAVKTTGEDRFHREWTLWLLWLLLILAMCEVGLALVWTLLECRCVYMILYQMIL